MDRLRGLLRRLRTQVRRDAADQELSAELDFHLERKDLGFGEQVQVDAFEVDGSQRIKLAAGDSARLHPAGAE